MKERRPNRLREYDYSTPGAYFVTVCANKHIENRDLFGEIRNRIMINNSMGDIIIATWRDLPDHYPNITLDEFVVMPDHFHGILWINNIAEVGNRHACSLQLHQPRRQSEILPNVMGSFKSAVSKYIHKEGFTWFQWQKSYYDHVIRNDKALSKIREYIRNNPIKWGVSHDDNEQDDILEIIGDCES